MLAFVTKRCELGTGWVEMSGIGYCSHLLSVSFRFPGRFGGRAAGQVQLFLSDLHEPLVQELTNLAPLILHLLYLSSEVR